MSTIRKTFDIEIKEKRENGGRIVISTGAVDRDRDRVIPEGAVIENYLKNPVVQYGHNYREPWATIGRTNELIIEAGRIEADFDLRPAANENDPQNVVLLLWNGNWIRTASIGFDPLATEENELGGYNFNQWDLLEWSLVPVPANQEALRLAVKAFGDDPEGARMIRVYCEHCGAKPANYSMTLAAQLMSHGHTLVCKDCFERLDAIQDQETLPDPDGTKEPEELDALAGVPEELAAVVSQFIGQVKENLA